MGQLHSVLGAIRELAGAETNRRLADRELLGRYISQGDGTAFEALLRRHGPMVLRVCLRILQSEHDAEDAFQATFLVLARKADKLRQAESVGSWLFGVASRVAFNIKRGLARRRSREGRAVEKPSVDALTEISVREAQQMLDLELGRLSEKFQAPFVLCCLEGMTRDEAARQLGLPVSTLRGRVERARELLRARLARRGLTLSFALSVCVLFEKTASAHLLPGLVTSTAKAATTLAAGGTATSMISAKVAALAEGVIRAMFWNKLKTASLGTLSVVILLAIGQASGIVSVGPGATSRSQPAKPGDGVTRDQEPSKDKSVLVCRSLQAKMLPDQIKTEVKAVKFTAPNGDGRRGAVGLLIETKADTGTRITFAFQRSKTGYGFQIIHPLKGGHILVSVHSNAVRLYRGGSWAEIGWGNPATGAKLAKMFPLLPDKKYQVVSELNAAGEYRLVINDIVFCDHDVNDAGPLILEMKDGPVWGGSEAPSLYGSFQGPDFKSKLPAGQAGVILGPTDGGGNTQFMERIEIGTGLD